MTVPSDRSRPRHLLFLFPLVHRPDKANFGGRFLGLSAEFRGSIFSLSGARSRGYRLGRFLFFSERVPRSGVGRWLRRLQVHLVLPLRLLWRERIDTIIAYDPFACGVAGAVLKLVLGGKLIVEINGDHHEPGPSRGRLKRALLSLALRISVWQADGIKLLNTSQERFFRRRWPRKAYFRFMDFVADGYFRSLPVEDEPYLLLVGYPFEYKGVGELIQAFQLLKDRYPSLELKIMGYCPPPEIHRFQRLAAGDPRIHFIPPAWMEEVGEAIRRCRILVNASYFEAGGRVIFEAMACRKPVVATRTNGPVDYIQHGVSGLLCEPRDARDLANKLQTLLDDPELARRIGEGGYQRLMEEATETRYLERYTAMINSL